MFIGHTFVDCVFNEHCKRVIKLMFIVFMIQYEQYDQNRKEEEIVAFFC